MMGILPGARTAAAQPGRKGQAMALQALSGRNRVALSQSATELAHSGVRVGMVSAIQQAIGAGSYHVSPGQVAEKLMESMLR